MSSKTTKKKKRKASRKTKKTTHTGWLHYVFAIILALVGIFSIVNQGVVGTALHHVSVLLFGTYSFIGNIYLVVLSYIVATQKYHQFFVSRWGLVLHITMVWLILISSYFGFNLYNSDLTSFGIYLSDLNNQDIYGPGSLGYILTIPFTFLFGNNGLIVIIILLIIVDIVVAIDVKESMDKMKAWRLHQKTKRLDKKMQKAEEARLRQEVKLEAMVNNVDEVREPEITATEVVSEPVVNLDCDHEIIDDEALDALIEENHSGDTIDLPSFDEPTDSISTPNPESDETLDISVMPQKLEAQEIKTKKVGKYVIPSINLLNDYSNQTNSLHQLEATAKEKAKVLIQTLETFNLKAKISKINVGPSVTKYELIPETGVKVSRFNNLHNDLAFALAAKNVRIEAPIPGKSAIGIEIPNDTNMMVGLREVLASKNNDMSKKLQIGLGKDIYGDACFCEIDKTPHLLIAGSTGSGKSVCVNSIIVSILTKALPSEVKLIMIDPKKVELTPYNGIPHLLAPVVTEPKKASIVLQKMVKEMEYRYELFSETNTRNIAGYNAKIKDEELKLPYIVIIVDELADLMMVASKEVETSIARLAQMARAAGMHLIIATQRPSTDVITGLIKANIPSRIAFAVSSGIDSRTILDQTGAEQLLGKGDMLLSEQSSPVLERIQGAFLSDEEIYKVVDFIKDQVDPETVEANYQDDLVNIEASQLEEELDPLYAEIKEYVIKTQKASASLFQRQYKIGYNRALRILDQLEDNGIISENEGTKPRRVLVGSEDGY